jgi:hypothetical protein
MRLAFLAPKVVEMIAAGRRPSELTAEALAERIDPPSFGPRKKKLWASDTPRHARSLPRIMAKRVVRNRAPCASSDGTASLVTEKSIVHCPQTGTLPGAGSVLHIHHFEALSTKNLKCAIFIGVLVNHDCAVSRLFLAGMRGDTRPLKATDTIRHVMSGPMAFTMKDPNLFHAASLPSIAMSISSSMNHSRSDTPAAIAGVTRKPG